MDNEKARKVLTVRLVNCLLRNRYGVRGRSVYEYGYDNLDLILDWNRIRSDYGKKISPSCLRMYGKKFHQLLGELLDNMPAHETESPKPEIVNCCPICKIFHEHNHGGLEVG